MMLEVRDLYVSYGGIRALKSISIGVEKGEFVAVIGANGSGKTTLLNSIMGFVKPQRGEIRFMGKIISNEPIWNRVKSGIGLIPEGGRIFPYLSVKQNLLAGAYSRKDKNVKTDLEWVYKIFPRLKERENQLGKTLSGGERQMLAIARTLMARPKLMLVDEITMGLMPILVSRLFKILGQLKSRGITMLIAEQNARKVLEVVDRAYVLERGKIVLEGDSQTLAESKVIKKAYLGG